MLDKINNALHEANYVHIGEHYIYVWHGGTYVNIYDQYFNAFQTRLGELRGFS